jgi:muconolactone delta-isomerase
MAALQAEPEKRGLFAAGARSCSGSRLRVMSRRRRFALAGRRAVRQVVADGDIVPGLINGGLPMKYIITWNERSQGSPMAYENAQKRILEVFTQWKAPDNFKIEMFVIRVGDWGGYMLLDCDDPLAVHKFCSMLPSFEFQARPVVPVMDAVRVELEAMAFRDGLKAA